MGADQVEDVANLHHQAHKDVVHLKGVMVAGLRSALAQGSKHGKSVHCDLL